SVVFLKCYKYSLRHVLVFTPTFGSKTSKLLDWKQKTEVKDTDILATFQVTPQLRVPLEEAEATVAAESFTGIWTIVQTDRFISLDRY
ncbi:hypothetical protein Golob_004590, partial [Gossypium lobatum]|nr:hypothetical protein [Gossypium lobatum]